MSLERTGLDTLADEAALVFGANVALVCFCLSLIHSFYEENEDTSWGSEKKSRNLKPNIAGQELDVTMSELSAS